MNELGIHPPDPEWDHWWAVNHPWDWWAKERNGVPLPTLDRLLVSQAMRDAYEAGRSAAHGGDSK